MHINLVSDLHLEFGDILLPGGDILILSGDICEVKNIKVNDYNPNYTTLPHERSDRRADRYARFFIEECAKYRQVIYVLGNHEHYHGCFDDTYLALKKQLPKNVHLLENQQIEIDDIVFIGSTLWTNFNKRDPITMLTVKDCMNDYRVIRKKYGEHYGKLSPEVTYAAHCDSFKFIESQLQLNKNRKCVVVTHHAPSSLSIAPEFKHEQHMNGAYFSSLEDLILENQHCVLWTHGHTHNYVNYKIGDTTVMCNPRGYHNYEYRSNEFDASIGYEI